MSLSYATAWARRNLLLLGAGVVVMGILIGAGSLIAGMADREDAMREAEVGAAELTTLAWAMGQHPSNVVDHGDATPSDRVVSRRLTASAVRAATAVDDNWHTPAAVQLGNATRATAVLSRETVGLALAGQLAPARRRLGPLTVRATALENQVRRVRAQLTREVDALQGQTQTGVLAVSAAVGAILFGILLAMTAARRRRAREEGEQIELARSERRLRALVRHGSDMITVVAPDTTVIYEAGAVRSMLGYEPDELEGAELTEWLHPDDRRALVSLCAGANGGTTAHELRFRHRDGSLRTCEARATSLLGDDTWDGIVLNIWDVSERKALEERLRHQAFHDGLTGLANRALFGDRLEHALVRAARAQRSVSVLLIDLDDFKSINDSLGHGAGDRLLGEVARRVGETMRAADTIARLGGDEFAVIVDDGVSETDDRRAAQRILAAVSHPFEIDGRSFPITASVGVARSVPGESRADQLVRDADLAMYAAKAQGKGTWAAYRSEMHIATEDRLQLKADLAHAIAAGNQLELYYQPVVALDSGDIVGLEALLRWNHPSRGQIAPGDFIPLAEETGAILPIGRWVLREACRQGRAWVDSSGKGLLMSVNVSARQLVDMELLGTVREALDESGLSPDRLVLEVTETELMRNVERASEVLGEIKRLGVRIAIDDFGTGYSSLSQLEHLPVDILKVDREFAGTPEDRSEHAKLLRAVMEIGDSLHLRTIAEGIETPDQLEEMRSLDYPLGQGFLFSRPMPSTEIDVMLAEQGGRVAGEAPPTRTR